MRLLELHLTAFGPFTQQTLTLTGGNHGLHVVFGPNEAGKSSALRALHAALYGIPGQTSDAFLHPYEALRVGARLRHSSGTELTFVRRKGNRNTLLAPDERRLDDHALDRFLGAESAEKFATFWGIDHSRLVEGGREILQGHGDLGEILFAAGSGVSHLRTMRRTLEEEAAALFAPRGHHRSVNESIGRLRELRSAQREATVSVDEWTLRQTALRDATDEVAKLSLQEQDLARERSRLDRVKRVLPLLAERKDICERLAALRDVVLLAEDFPNRRLNAENALRSAKQDLDRTEKEIDEQQQHIERLGTTPRLALESEAVNQLHVDLGKHRKALTDRPKLTGQGGEQRSIAKRLLGEWRPDLAIEAVASLRVFLGRRARIQKLSAQRERLDERLDAARLDGDKAHLQEEALKRSLSELPPARDAERLVAVISEARLEGDAEGLREKTAQAVQRLTTQRDSMMVKLGVSASAAERLEELRVPSAAAIARFEARKKELDDDIRAGRTERQRIDKATRDLTAKINTLHAKRAVPTEKDLAAVRERRDAAFDLLREQWENDHDVSEQARELLGKGKLIDIYPRTVRAADEVADRLRSEADHVAALAQFLEEQERMSKAVQDSEDAARRHKASAVDLDAEWTNVWKPALPTPPVIDDARAWRADFDRLLERSDEIAKARDEAKRLDASIEKHVKSLRAVISALDADVRPLLGLVPSLVAAEQLRKRIEKESHAREEHARRTRENAQALIDSERSRRKTQAEIDEWAKAWKDTTDGLLPGAGAPPDDALAALDVVDKVLGALHEAEGYDIRIAGIDRDAEKFRNDVRALASRLCETVDQAAEDAWVEGIHERLAAALREEERRRQAGKHLTDLQDGVARDRKAVNAAEGALTALQEEARCGPEADLTAIEQRSTELRKCRSDLARIERDLIRSGDGATIEGLEAEASATDRDTIDARLAEIGMLRAEVEKALGLARDARAAAQAQLNLLEGPSVASEKAQEIQGTLAKLRDDVLRYARLRVASTLLARRIDDYRRSNQAPLLQRAGELFREMTLNTFVRLEADMDDDRPILAGVKPDEKRVPAHGMSEGTRDQLFLALRLAAVEASCATGEPLPFVVDDILVQFDDVRGAAALRVIAKVAAHTQVVLFTHHQHVRAGAEALASTADVHIHDLVSVRGG